MKKFCISFLTITATAFAADAPGDLTFKGTTLGVPPLTLSQGQPKYVPTAPTDLISPAATREGIIRNFRASESKAKKRQGPIVPLGPLDLIGPSSDREKLIEHFDRTQSAKEKGPNQSVAP
jgi:hypothetical protein